MIRILLGFIGGVLYGTIQTVQVPDGVLAQIAALIKMVFF